MRAQRTSLTGPEVALRAELRRLGLRPRTTRVAVDEGRPILPDLVWTRQRVAVFVQGEWWHGCPKHYRPPRANAAWWAAKVAGNRARDARQARRLRAAGWRVLTVWECDDMARAARRVALAVGGAR